MADNMTQEEIDAHLEKYAKWLDNGVITQAEYDEAVKDAAAGIRGYTAQLKASLNQLGTSVKSLIGDVAKGQEGASLYNNSLNSAADVVDKYASKHGLAGKVIGTVVTAAAKYASAVNEQADALFKNYNEMSRYGAAGANGMKGVYDNLHKFGYKISELGSMGALVKENASSLAVLGGTVDEGVGRFAAMSTTIRQSAIGEQFKEMGIPIQNINEGIAGYLTIQTMTGRTAVMSQAELTQGAADYIYQQDRLTKLTGLSADAQQKLAMDSLRNSRWSATLFDINQKTDDASQAKRKQLEEANERIGAISPELQKGFQDLASGTANSPDAQKFLRAFPEAAKQITSGTFQSTKFLEQMGHDAKVTQDTFADLAKSGNTDTIIGNFSEIGKVQTAFNKNLAAADATVARQQKITDPNTKNMVNLTTAQRNTTLEAEQVINKGINPATDAMSTLAKTMEKITGIPSKVAPSLKATGTSPTGGPAGGTLPEGKPSSEKSIKSVVEAGPGYTTVLATDGEKQRREGVRNWRNNNPGNLEYGKFSQSKGAVGTDGRFAVFPTLSAGMRAKEDLLFGDTYRGLTIAQAISKYAPAFENNTGNYLNQLLSATGAGPTTIMGDLNSGQRASLLGAINKAEGFKPGKIISAAKGGVASGPTSGYRAILHGTEAIVPLPDGKSIPVQMVGDNNTDEEEAEMMMRQLGKLNLLVGAMAKHVDITSKILKAKG